MTWQSELFLPFVMMIVSSLTRLLHKRVMLRSRVKLLYGLPFDMFFLAGAANAKPTCGALVLRFVTNFNTTMILKQVTQSNMMISLRLAMLLNTIP